MKKIFITQKIPARGVDLLKGKGYQVDVYKGEGVPSQDELITHLKKDSYDAIMCMLTDTIDSRIFDAVPSAKLFASYTVGYNNIDVEEAKKRDITITNTSGSSYTAVAEHTIALMLGLTTRMVEGDSFVRNGKYNGWTPMAFIGRDISNKIIGLIGTGAIGAEVARMTSKGFNAKIIYYDLVRNEKLENECEALRLETIDELLKKADIVSLHVPLLSSTHHLINKEKIEMMKPTSYLVNTSRGPIIDESALVEALKNKVIAGAGLDVFENEPALAKDLETLNNIILTPHIASAREEARNEMAEIAANNIIDFLEGHVPRNKINI